MRLFSFTGGDHGIWRITSVATLLGEALPAAARLDLRAGNAGADAAGSRGWVLRGITSNERYVARGEKARLVAKQEGLGRPAASCAALIPIRKTPSWWALTQEERRAIFEEQSHHIEIGTRVLPPVARRLHHCRDLSESEPFDFLTWFEFAPAYAAAFDGRRLGRPAKEFRWQSTSSTT